MPTETAAAKKAREAAEQAEAEAQAQAQADAQKAAEEALWQPKGAAAKLAWIQTHVVSVAKTGTHAQGYSYMQEHGLLDLLRPLLRQQRCAIVLSPAAHGYHLTDDQTSAVVHGTLTFTDTEAPVFLFDKDGNVVLGENGRPIENPDRSIVAVFANEGHWNNAKSALGKGLNKATTGFSKYALQKFFAIPTEQIDDNDASEVADVAQEVAADRGQQPPAATAGQASTQAVDHPAQERIDALLKFAADSVQAGTLSPDRFKAKLATYGTDAVKDLNVADFEDLGKWTKEQVDKATVAAAPAEG